MGIIRIFANGIELDYRRESLKVKKESNAFITDFKVSHSSYPFLIVENVNTKRALGTRDMTSVLKQNTVPVTVLENGDRYYGELQTLSYMNGYRKCNLKYGSDLLKIMGKKLSALLPTISVIPGETDPVLFTEQAFEVVAGYENWEEFPLAVAGKIFPEADYQFPELAWKDKFHEEPPEPGDEWYYYLFRYNRFNGSIPSFRTNYYTVEGESGQLINVFNNQVPSPQLFLLGILRLAFAREGYTIAGAFTETEFIKRLLVLSTKANLCEVNIAPEMQAFTYADMESVGITLPPFIFYYKYRWPFVPDAPGEYTFTYLVEEPLRSGGNPNDPVSIMFYRQDGNDTLVWENYNDPEKLIFQGEFTISVSPEQVGNTIGIYWARHVDRPAAAPIQMNVKWSSETKVFQMMHPTIPLGRYAPDWTLSDYINEVKKLFCLNVRMDDQARVVHFDYTGDLIRNGNVYNAGKSLALSDYAPPAYNAILLQYGNDEDNCLYIDRTGAQLNRREESDLVLDIQSKFKLVPHDSYTSDISKSEDKDGVGLMIYDPGDYEGFRVPVTSANYNGQTLSMEGATGIYQMFWKRAVQFRLNASAVDIEGPFTETEIGKMLAAQKVHIDNQTYVIISLDYSETRQGNYKVMLKLESVTL